MKVYQKIILILLGLLILPITILGVNADTIELPYDSRIGNSNYEYVILEYFSYGKLYYSLHFAERGFNFTYTDNRLRIFNRSGDYNLVWNEVDYSDWETNTHKAYISDYGKDIYSNVRIIYSSQDIYDDSGDLVFQKTPADSLVMAQRRGLENLEKEVQGASGRILAVGGVILGAVLVTHLVSRLRLWATR